MPRILRENFNLEIEVLVPVLRILKATRQGTITRGISVGRRRKEKQIPGLSLGLSRIRKSGR